MWTLENAARLLNLGVTKDLKQKEQVTLHAKKASGPLLLPCRKWRSCGYQHVNGGDLQQPTGMNGYRGLAHRDIHLWMNNGTLLGQVQHLGPIM
jgi:hypothetical protein